MKIVSLLPSATEIVYALGLEDNLVAVTHECDYPPGAAEKPVITSSVLDNELGSSSHIHKGIAGLLHEGKSIYHLDEELLGKLKPDLILTQELCDVCAVSYDIVAEAAKILTADAEIISLEPNSLPDILANIRLVGERTARSAHCEQLVTDLERRIEFVANQTKRMKHRPKVYCMEWVDPPFAAGHWIPEMVSLAGGIEGLGRSGQPSHQLQWAEVLDYAPEIVILMPCGFDLRRTLEEVDYLSTVRGWTGLPAVRNGKVFAADGSAYFNRPGPRIVDGLEILAQIIQPELFDFSFRASAWCKVETG